MKYLQRLIIFFVFIVTGLLFFWPSHQSNVKQLLPSVSVINVKQQIVQDSWQAIGTAKAVQSIELSAEVSGIVQAIDVRSGQTVTQGQLLVRLRHDDLEAALVKLQVKCAQDEKNNQRSKKLFVAHVISAVDRERAEETLRQDQAELKQQQALIEKYQVTAPFSGSLGMMQINVGQYVAAGQVLSTLDQLDKMYVDFSIPERLIGQMNFNDPIILSVAAYPMQKFSARLFAIGSALDLASRSLPVRLEVNNADKKLLSGMAATVLIKQKPKTAVVIPEVAISYEPEGAIVYVLDKTKHVHRKVLVIAHQGNDCVAENSVLQPGDQIVLAGQQKLYDGMLVRVVSGGQL